MNKETKKIKRSYKITTVEAKALEELCNLNGRLKGLSLTEEKEMPKGKVEYTINVIDDENAWDTIVDGKNLFFHLYMNEANENKTSRKYNRYLRAMKKVCVKDINATYSVNMNRKHI